jgi:hypothetical protein
MVAQAKIFFQDIDKTILTDNTGKFNIVLPVGEHSMTVSYPALRGAKV